jgi:PAS domain S-box-containing protein
VSQLDPSAGGADVIDATRRAAAQVTSSPDPIISTTLDGVITDWNPAAARMYGYSAEEALGASVSLLVPPELSPSDLIETVRRGGTVSGFDTQRLTKSGERVDVSISLAPIRDERGAVVGVAGFTRDINIRVLAEERLRKSETLLAEAQELAGIGSWEWDVVSDDVTWSAGLFRILGLDPERDAPSYDGYHSRIHPDDLPVAEANIAAMLAIGGQALQELRLVGADGVERIVEMRTRASTGAGGTIVRLRGTTQDVSERVHSRQRLDRANRRNQALLNSAGEGIYGIDRDGTTIFANPVAARLTGHAVTELVGRSRHEGFRHTRSDGTPYEDRDCPVSASLEDGTVHRCDSDLYWRRDGTSFPVEYTSTPIVEGERVVGAVVVFKDISERREVERAKDDFVASISHELRSPLTSIRGYLELIGDEQSGDLNDEQRRYLTIIERNADRLQRVVGDLLLIAQVDAGAIALELDLVDAGELIEHAIDVARPHAQSKGLELEAQVVATPALRGDRARLGQVLDNVLSNAIKFTPAGGRVVLRAFARDGDRVVIEIADDGLGMSAREQEQLFQAFYRTPAASELGIRGTGLGLTIVRALVEAHGGAVSLTSATGEGTTFRIELPLGDHRVVAAPANAWRRQLGRR